jgi:hypothetical protein
MAAPFEEANEQKAIDGVVLGKQHLQRPLAVPATVLRWRCHDSDRDSPRSIGM